MDKKEKLNDFEEEMLFGAIRYYMGRQTIVSATFPAGFIRERIYERVSRHTLSIIIRDLEDHLRMFKTFGSPEIDDKYWKKLLSFLKGYLNGFSEVHLISGEICKVFEIDFQDRGEQVHRVYPVEEYINYPEREIELLIEKTLEENETT